MTDRIFVAALAGLAVFAATAIIWAAITMFLSGSPVLLVALGAGIGTAILAFLIDLATDRGDR